MLEFSAKSSLAPMVVEIQCDEIQLKFDQNSINHGICQIRGCRVTVSTTYMHHPYCPTSVMYSECLAYAGTDRSQDTEYAGHPEIGDRGADLLRLVGQMAKNDPYRLSEVAGYSTAAGRTRASKTARRASSRRCTRRCWKHCRR